MTSSFEEFQTKFMQAVLSDDDSILADVKDSSKENRRTLLGVYRHAYGARLEEFLINDFPITYAYLGEENFSALATSYAAAHPSDSPNARWYGRHLPSHATHQSANQTNPEIAELTALELALNSAFDAADQVSLGLNDLAALPPEAWPEMTFAPHPSISRLSQKTNAAEIWAALSKEQSPPESIKQPEPIELIIWRGEGLARYRPMAYDEAMIWDEAMKGANFAALCEMLGTYWPQEGASIKAAGYLQTWLTSEFLIDPKT